MKKETLLKLKKNLLITSLILGTSFTGINTNKINSYAMETSINKEDNRLYDLDEMINYYCKVFSLKEDVVKDKLYNMTISDMIPLKDNKYIRLTLTRNNSKITVMSFSLSPAEFPFKTGDVVDLAVTLDINEYKGIENLTVILKDIKTSQTENSTYIDSLRIFEAFCKGDALSKSQFLSIYPSPQIQADVSCAGGCPLRRTSAQYCPHFAEFPVLPTQCSAYAFTSDCFLPFKYQPNYCMIKEL